MSLASGAGRELAVLLSVAARIEPELMRAVRLRAARDLDVAAEVDLWFGDLVGQRGFGFVVLDPRQLPDLRAELGARLRRADEDDPIRHLWPTFLEVRAGQSPALVAQETATWQAVSGGLEADRRIEESLQPALRALVEEDGREGIARWFLGAWDTLPERVQRSTTAWQLFTLSAVKLAEAPPSTPRPPRLALSDVAVIAEGLPQVPLYLRWAEHRLLVSDGDLGPDTFAITVPDTDPRVVELVTASSVRTILIQRDSSVEEWVGPGSGWLCTADGAMYLLPIPADTRSHAVPTTPADGADEPDEAGGTDAERLPAAGHISICYAGESRSWAMWTARQLERAGCTTTLLRWDTASRPPTESLGALLAAPGQVLLLVNERALRPDLHSDRAWAEAFRMIVGPHRDRFAAITLTTASLPEGTDLLRPVDVGGLDEEEARRTILERLGVPPGDPPAHPEGPRFPNEPAQVRDAPRRNGYFTGRKDDLEELSELLAESGPGGARVVLHGIPGVGKSQLATEYAHRYGDAYDVVWWIRASQRGTAREEFAALAAHLELAAGRDSGERIRAVHLALRERTASRHRWLLIFDGADEVDTIRDLIPEGRGDVIITSLTRDWVSLLAFQEYTVRPFTRNESVTFIRRRVPRVTAAEAEQLAEAAQDLPLVLAQTTAWLIANETERVFEYVEALQSQSPEELEVVTEEDYPHGFVMSWAHFLNALRRRNPEAAELIELMAMFSPDTIPLQLITAAPTGVFPPGRLAATVSDSTRWQNALAELAHLTAIHLTYTQDPSLEYGVESAQMHRLYHRFIRGNLDVRTRATLSATACGILAAAKPERTTNPREWPLYARLIPHLDTAGALERDEPDVRALLLDCIDNLRVRGEYDTGLRLCQKAVTHWRPRYPGTDPDMLTLEHQHANLLRRMGRYRDAEAVGAQTVDMLAPIRRPDDSELLRAKDGLGGTLMALGRFHRARDLFEEVWHGYTARWGQQDKHALEAKSNMALTLGLLGRYRQSLDLHRELFELRSRRLGGDHYSTLYSGLHMAWMTRLLGRYSDALALQQLNARVHSRTLGPLHPQTLRAEHNLAQCLRRDGRVDDAASLFTSVLKRSEQAQGELHPETLMMAADRATLVRSESPREAHELAGTVYERYLRLLGPDHPYTAGSLSNMALARWAEGDGRPDAEGSALTAWRLMARAVGDEHPWTLGCRLNLTAMLVRAGQADTALDHDIDLAAMAVRQLGERHPLTLAAATARAHDLRELGRTDEAEELRRETVALLRDTLGPQHPHTRSADELRRPHWDFEPQPI
ncbi:FxSxx-COOH system tetratricopeptide repeat protein [Streptomyces bobili]|uniref:FxSxx-COOH system tetratricopeptide repeat protein n=1 Tax=Streptomyces bobili TaxID=67280 RepID=UPI002253C5E4|nr:FxSxx-COOH system tetratricopeptide repeat protein [Streptomyces bobili]MCX5521962.1 FxSxx-COOH system tetratricopeptide repeat protein [Streptomyces bobili]